MELAGGGREAWSTWSIHVELAPLDAEGEPGGAGAAGGDDGDGDGDGGDVASDVTALDVRQTADADGGARADGSSASRALRPGRFALVDDRPGSSVSLRRVVGMSPAMREWVAGRHRTAAVHDVHVTMHDQAGAVVARYCLRRAGVARVGGDVDAIGDDAAIDELVLTCERIDLEPVG